LIREKQWGEIFRFRKGARWRCWIGVLPGSEVGEGNAPFENKRPKIREENQRKWCGSANGKRSYRRGTTTYSGEHCGKHEGTAEEGESSSRRRRKILSKRKARNPGRTGAYKPKVAGGKEQKSRRTS